MAKAQDDLQAIGIASVPADRSWRTGADSRFFAKTSAGRFVAAGPLVLSAHALRRDGDSAGSAGAGYPAAPEALFRDPASIHSVVPEMPGAGTATAGARDGEDGMERVMEYLREHFREDVPMKILADLVRLSLRQFHRNFKKRFGIPPNQYLIRMRVTAAQNMLVSDNRPISEIAYTLGFADDTLFIRQFKARLGMTPLQYRKSRR